MKFSTASLVRRVRFAATILVVLATLVVVNRPQAAHAQNMYFDVNGATAGDGVVTGQTYNWTGNYWSSSSAGTAATGAWNSAYTACFNGITGGTATAYNIDASANSLTGGINVGSVTACTVTLVNVGNNFYLGGPCTWTVNTGSTLIDNNNNNGDVNLNGNTLTLAGGGNITFGGGGIDHSGSTVTDNMTGTVTITAPAVGGFGTNFNFNSGTLLLAASGALGTAPFNINGGTLDNTSGAAMTLLGGSNSIGGNFTFLGSSALNLGTGAVAMTNNPTITVNQSTLTIGGAISGAGQSLTLAGSGTLVLSSANTFSGVTTVSGGTLTLGNALSLQNSTLNLSGAGVLNFSGLSTLTLGGLQGSGNLVLTNASSQAVPLTVGSSNASTTYSGSISDNGTNASLTKVGTGTLTLTGTNSYGGVTTISNGGLVFGTASALPTTLTSNAITLNGGYVGVAGYSVNALLNSGLITASPASGGIALTAADSENINFATAGTGTYGNLGLGSAGTNIYSGTLTPTNNLYRLGGGGGTLVMANGLSVSAGSLLVNGNVTLLGASSYSGTTTITAGTLQVDNGGSTATLGSGAIVNNGALAFSRSDSALMVSQNISGTGQLWQIGTGVTTLSGSDSYTGGTNVTAGTLVISGVSPAPGTINVASGAMLQLATGSGQVNNMGAVTYTGAGTVQKTGTSRYNGGGGADTIYMSAGGLIDVEGGNWYSSGYSNVVSPNNMGSLNIGSGALFYSDAGGTIAFDALTGSGTFSGPYGNTTLNLGVANGGGTWAGSITSGNGQYSINKTGSGTETFSGANTYSGGTTISGGVLQLTNALALQDSTLNTSGAGTLNISALSSLTLGGLQGSGNLTLANSNSAAVPLTVGGNGATTTYSGALSDNALGAGLTKVGAGVLTLTGNNSYSGGTTISAGGLVFSTAAALPSTPASNAITLSGGYLGAAGPYTTVNAWLNSGLITASPTSGGIALTTSSSENINFATAGTGTYTGTYANLGLGSIGTNTYSGTLTPVGNVYRLGGGGGTLVMANGLSGSGVGLLVNGNVNLLGASSFTGGSTVGAGVLQLGIATALPSSTVTVNVNGGLSFATGISPTIGGLAGPGNVALTDASNNAISLTVGGNGASTAYSGALSGGGSLVKIGTGTLTLTGNNNSYTGGTSVNGGTLQLNAANAQYGQLNGTPSITVNSGATLALNAGDVLGYTAGKEALIINSGATVTNITPGSRVTIGNTITMTGGTLTGTGTGDANGQYSFYTGAGITATSDASGNPALISASISPQTQTLAINVTRGVASPPSDLTISGAIIPYGATVYGITETGNGILTLTAANTYTGGTTVSGGTLQLSGGNNRLPTAGAITVAGGLLDLGGYGQTTSGSVAFQSGTLQDGTLTATGSAYAAQSGTVTATLAGTVGLTKTTAGGLVLGAANTYSGNTLISAGTLSLANSLALQNSTLDTSGAGTLNFGTLTAASIGGLINGGSLTLQNGSGAALALSVGNNGSSSTYSGALAGSGSLIKVGSGALVLGGANTYTGGTTIAAGTLVFSSTAAAPAGTQNITINTPGGLGIGGTYPTAASWLASNLINPASTGALALTTSSSQNMNFAGLNSLALGASGTQTYSGTITPANNTYNLGGGGGTLVMATTLTDNGSTSQGLLVNGSVILMDANSYSGGTTIGATGTLQVGNGDGTATLGSGAIVDNGTLAFSRSDTGLTVPGGIAGTGGVLQNGSGMTTLTGASTYTGPTLVTAGTLNIAAAGSLTNAGNINTRSGGVLSISGTVNQGPNSYFATGNGLSGTTGTTNVNTGAVLNLGNNAVLIGGSTTTNGQYGAGTFNLNGGLVTVGAGGGASGGADANNIWINLYGGTTTSTLNLNGGTLSTARAILDGGSGHSALHFNGGDLQAAANLSPMFSVANAYVDAGGATIDTQGNTVTVSQALLHGTGAPDGGLTKLGSGLLTLAGADTYTGPTTVSAGTLQLNGVAFVTTAGSYTINSGAVLALSLSSYSNGDSGGLSEPTAGATFSGSGTLQIASGWLSNSNGHGGQVVMSLGAGGVINIPAGTGIQNGGWQNITWTNNLASLNVNGGFDLWDGNQVRVDALTGSGSVIDPNYGNALLIGVNNGSGTFSGVISNAIALTKNGTGIEVFTGANTYTNGTTINGGTLQIGNGGNTGAVGSGAIANNATLVFDRSDTGLVVPGAISGSGSLVQTGGLVTLSNNNSYTGTTTISAGTLQLGNGGANGSLGTGATVDNGTLTFNFNTGGNASLPAGSNISGSGNLNVTSGKTTLNGNIALSGSQSFTELNFSGGPSYAGIDVAVNSTLTASAINVYSDIGTTAYQSHSNTLTLDTSAVNGPMNLNFGIGGSGIFYVAGGVTATAGTGQINVTGTGPNNVGWGAPVALTGAVNITANVAESGVTINTNSTTTGSVSGVLAGSTLTVQGPGMLTLSNTNTYTGTTTISGGTLQLGNGTTDGSVSSSSNIANNGVLLYNVAVGQSYANVISGSGSVTKTGPGTLALGGANTYKGPTSITGGVVQISAPNNLGDYTQATNTIAISGGTLESTANTYDLGSNRAVTLGGPATLQSDAGGLTVSGPVTNGANPLTVTGAGNTTISGAISNGSGGLTMSGAGVLTLSANNSYTGGTTISNGTVSVTKNNALGTGTVNLAAGGNLVISSTASISGLVGNYYNFANTSDLASLSAFNAALSGKTPALISNSTAAGTSFNFGSTGSSFPAPYNTGTPVFEAQWNGLFDAPTAGTYTFTTASDDGSAIWIDGTEVVNNDYSQPITARAGTVTLTSGEHNIVVGYNNTGGGYGFYAQVAYPGQATEYLPNSLLSTGAAGDNSLTIASLSGAAGSTVTLGTGVLTTGSDNTSTTFAGVISGAGGSLVKVGSGVMTLSGANTYTGGTTVGGGMLAVNGSLASAAVTVSAGSLAVNGSLGGTAVTIAGGTVLSGTGTIAGAVSVASGAATTNQGTINLVDGTIGTLTLTNPGTALTLGTSSGSAVLDFEIGANSTDQLALTAGSLNLNSSVTINLTQLGATQLSSGTYNLLSFSGGTGGSGSFTLGSLGGLPASLVSLNTTANDEQLIIQPGMPAVAYWSGAADGTWSNKANWATDVSGGTAVLSVPGSISDVYFTATSGTNLTTTLDTNFAVKSLNYTATSASVAINGTNTLTIATAAGINDPAGSAAQAINANVALGAAQTWTVNSASPLTVGGVISGANTATLTLAGSGTVVLTASNSYTGLTTINAGALQLGNGTTNGSVSGDIVNNASLIVANGTALSYGGNITGSGGVILEGAGAVTLCGANGYSGGTTIDGGAALVLGNASALGTGALALSGSLNLASYSSTVASLSLTGGALTGSGQTLTVSGIAPIDAESGAISANLAGNVALDKTTGGTVVLSGNNNVYTGGTSISAGMVQLGSAAALPNGGALTVNSGTLDLAGNSPTVGALAGAGGVISNSTGAATLGVNTAASTTFGGTIADGAGTTGLVKNGSGTLALTNAANNYSGGTTVSGGVLQLGSAAALGSTLGNLTVNAGTLNLAGNSPTVGALSGASGVISTSTRATLTVGSGDASSAFSGVIVDGVGAVALVKTGAGTLTLAGANGYSGGTTIGGGVLAIGNANNLGSGSVTIGAGTLQTSGNVVLDAARTVTLADPTSTIDTPNQGDLATISGSLGGSGALNKTGAGTLALADTSGATYSGDTNVSAGILDVVADNALSPTSNLVIGDGASVILDFGGGAGSDGIVAFTGGAPALAAPALATAALAAPALPPAGISTVPEPGTLMLLLVGVLASLVVWRRRS